MKIKLSFASSAGDYEEEFPVNQPLKAVEKQVLAQLGLDPSKADDFVITLDGEVLDETKSLQELGLEDCTLLAVERREVTKIGIFRRT